MVGDVWRWGMKDAAAHEDVSKAWRQLMRWRVADVPQRAELTVEPLAGDANGAMRYPGAGARRKLPSTGRRGCQAVEVEPVRFGAEVAEKPASIKFQGRTDGHGAGAVSTTFVPRQTGGYLGEAAVVTNAVGAETARRRGGLEHGPRGGGVSVR